MNVRTSELLSTYKETYNSFNDMVGTAELNKFEELQKDLAKTGL